jgi:hypothetical protein
MRPVWKAHHAITDPEFFLDTPLLLGGENNEPTIVREPTRLELFKGAVTLEFDKATYAVHVTTAPTIFPHDALRYFLTYQSRVEYNMIFPGAIARAATPSDHVTFHLTRNGPTWEGTPHEITITQETLEAFLQHFTYELNLALAYYLIGCDQPRYFLIEFYKAIEVIANTFSGEHKAINALKEHGVIPTDFKKVKEHANHQRRPFNVGRHAPLPNAEVRHIDVRRLLEEPLSREVFTESLKATRQAIDAYFAYLRAKT